MENNDNATEANDDQSMLASKIAEKIKGIRLISSQRILTVL